MSKMGKEDKIPCDRCGVCCSTGTCSHGIEYSYGICIYLITNNVITNGNERTSCKLLLENKIKDPKDIGMGVGCVLKKLGADAYNYYHLQMVERLEFRNK